MGFDIFRWHLTADRGTFDQQRGGTMAIGGGGETHLEMKKRLIAEKEAKIHKQLSHVENQRSQNRLERVNRHIPQIALIGYTNAGKSSDNNSFETLYDLIFKIEYASNCFLFIGAKFYKNLLIELRKAKSLSNLKSH